MRPDESELLRQFLVWTEALEEIRNVLLIGLAAYGEIERLSDAQEMERTCPGARSPQDLRVIHPTGSANTVSEFADALRALDSLVDLRTEVRQARAPEKPEAP